jgi:hypothetical protein
MNHESVGQIVRAGNNRLADADRRQPAAFLRQARAGFAVDGAGNPRAGLKLGIGGANHRIDPSLIGDVALKALNGDAVEISQSHEWLRKRVLDKGLRRREAKKSAP